MWNSAIDMLRFFRSIHILYHDASFSFHANVNPYLPFVSMRGQWKNNLSRASLLVYSRNLTFHTIRTVRSGKGAQLRRYPKSQTSQSYNHTIARRLSEQDRLTFDVARARLEERGTIGVYAHCDVTL